MSEIYCLYKEKKYEAEIKKNKIEITSNCKDEGFVEYVDVLGRAHNDLFVKMLDIDAVDIIYKEDVYIKHKEEYFQLFADKIIKSAVLENSYMIWTSSEQLAHEYVFQKKEQFVFIKFITREEIEAIKIVKRPILDFEDKETVEEVLEGDALDKWLAELL